MSLIDSLSDPLLTVLPTLGGGWLVTTRVTDRWEQIKQSREMDLNAAQDFQRLYGEFVSIWKSWDSLKGSHSPVTAPEHPGWAYLERASAMEGQIEALMAKLAAERFLAEEQIDILGGVRQAFKEVRGSIHRGEPLGWWSSEVEQYAALKSLSAAMSVIIGETSWLKSRPDVTTAARNFKEITSNRHEISWIHTAQRLN
ncbi:hypothetical protein [Streptomyces sp. NPDC127066]|uniref:hypothetical protein n=1 Tax=Streptomyces sp. NPDC127066 TaxID=3347125 RepID=UPI0036550128